MREVLYFFGYASIKEDPENFTGFHEFKETDPELHKQYYGFRQLNSHSLEWNASMNDIERQEFQFMCSDPEKEVPVLNFEEGQKIIECTLHDAEIRLFGKARQPCE